MPFNFISGGNITRVFPGHPMTKTLSFPEFPLQGALVQSLIRELRSHMPCSTVKTTTTTTVI